MHFIPVMHRSPSLKWSTIAAVASPWFPLEFIPNTLSAYLDDTTTPTATVAFEYSQDGLTRAHGDSTVNLTAAASSTGKALQFEPWRYVRLNVSALAGTNAKVNFVIGC